MYISKLKFLRVSAQKARLVADQIRGMSVGKASDLLAFSPKKSALLLKKALMSAVANAEHNHGADIDELRVDQICVDVGPTYKRFHARAKGRGNRILKRTCHVTMVLSDSTKTV